MTEPVLLYVATRWPWPVATGRQRMIDQALRFAAREHRVVLAAFTRDGRLPPPPPDAPVAETIALPLPGAASVLSDALRRPDRALQEHLFASPAARRILADAAARLRPTVAVFDMLRTAQYGEDAAAWPGCRRVLDLDDLLSKRYRGMGLAGVGGVLGAFERRLPAPVRAMAALMPGMALRVEAALIARRERTLPGRFDSTLLVSPVEAEWLAACCDQTVAAAPPAVADLPPVLWDEGAPLRFVFVGAAGYAGNAEALRVLDAVCAATARRGSPLVVDAYGDPAGAPPLDPARVRLRGYVRDVANAFAGRAVLVAPMGRGGGVKTKILEAMARGVPVLTNAAGLEGLGARRGVEVLVAEGTAGFADEMQRVAAAPDALRKVGLAGRAYVGAAHGEERVRECFLSVLRGPNGMLPAGVLEPEGAP